MDFDWRKLIDAVPVLGQQKQIAESIYAMNNRDNPQPSQGGGAIGRLPLPTGNASGKLPMPRGDASGKLPLGDGGGMPIEPMGDPQINPQVKNYLLNKRNVVNQPISQAKPGFDMGGDLQEMQNLNSQTPQAMPQKQQMPIPEIQEKPEAGSNERLNKWLAILGGGLVAGGGGQGAAQMMSNLDAIRAREIETDSNNPNSKESIHARQLAKKLYGDQYEVNPNLTARQFKEASPVMNELYERTYKQRQEEKADKRYAAEQEFRKQQAGESTRQFNERMAQEKANQEDTRRLNWARFELERQSREDAKALRQMAAQSSRGVSSSRSDGYGAVKRDAAHQKKLDEYRENLDALSESKNMRQNIEKFNRGALGKITPDLFLTAEDKGTRNAIERASTAQAKLIAGPGVFQIAEKHLYEPLVANPSQSKDVALSTINKIVVDGTQKSMSSLNRDLKMNNISFDDFVKIREDYDKSLRDFGYRLDANDNVVPR